MSYKRDILMPEHILENVAATMHPITYNGNVFTSSFHYGGKDELNRYLDKFKDKVYPLIWMIPQRETHDIGEVRSDTEFIIAMNFEEHQKDKLNNERFTKAFGGILNPIASEFMFRILRSQHCSFDNKDFGIFKRPNYRETKGDQPDSIHYWDALTLSLKMSFND